MHLYISHSGAFLYGIMKVYDSHHYVPATKQELVTLQRRWFSSQKRKTMACKNW